MKKHLISLVLATTGITLHADTVLVVQPERPTITVSMTMIRALMIQNLDRKIEKAESERTQTKCEVSKAHEDVCMAHANARRYLKYEDTRPEYEKACKIAEQKHYRLTVELEALDERIKALYKRRFTLTDPNTKIIIKPESIVLAQPSLIRAYGSANYGGQASHLVYQS